MSVEVTGTTHITITNLKAATSIADDKLSAHNPNGSGNVTAMSDFLVDAIGIWDSANAQWLQTLERESPDGTYEDGDTFKLYFQVERADLPSGADKGRFWPEQIYNESGFRAFIENLSYTSYSTTVNSERIKVVLEFAIDGAGGVEYHILPEGDLNQHAINYLASGAGGSGDRLTYDSGNDGDVTIRSNQAAMDCLQYTKTTSGETRFDVELYDPDNTINEYVEFDVGPTGTDHTDTDSNDDGFATWDAYDHGVTTIETKSIELTLRDGAGGTIIQQDTVNWETDTNGQTDISSFGC